jgi:hypothetical protein
MKKVKHNETLIGRFANLTGNVMYFDGGENCSETNEFRTFELNLVCSDDNAFLSASAPTNCAYRGVFGTPIACNRTSADSLETVSLKKLEKLMTVLNLPKD